MARDTITICNPPERRVSSTGKVRYTVAVKSEPLVHSFDPKTLGAPVAHAITESLRTKMKAISAVASVATQRARAAAAKSFAASKPSATKRYSGGRLGPMAPNQSNRLFNDSGRFAASLTANARDDAWTVNVAANRLDETTAGGELGVRRIWNRLVALVPAFGNPGLLFSEPALEKAVSTSVEALIVKAKATNEALSAAAAQARAQLAAQALGLIRLMVA
jgi:hypothetical protein